VSAAVRIALEKADRGAYNTPIMTRSMVLCWAFILAVTPWAQAMDYAEERQVAQEFVDLLERNNLVIHDEEITVPVQILLERLAHRLPNPLYRYRLHVVRDRSVNAFTIPDGHIFVNLGLLMFARDMDEIAAVIGHEMGHAQLRHIPETLETQAKITAATALGILAGTLLSSKNPEAGAAMIFSSLGGGENLKLAYSRQHEFAADEFGAGILKSSGIDPSAMTRFLARLNATSGASGVPEYLLTHPLTDKRVAAIATDAGSPRPDETYLRLQACIFGLLLPAQEASLRSSTLPEPYRSLAIALVKYRSGDYAGAMALLEGIDLDIARATKGLVLYAMGRSEEAYPLLSSYGRTASARTAQAEILRGRGRYAEAIELLKPYSGQNPRADYVLGVLYEGMGNQALSHVSFARYFFRSANRSPSLFHIQEALKRRDELPQGVAEELEKMREALRQEASERK